MRRRCLKLFQNIRNVLTRSSSQRADTHDLHRHWAIFAGVQRFKNRANATPFRQTANDISLGHHMTHERLRCQIVIAKMVERGSAHAVHR